MQVLPQAFPTVQTLLRAPEMVGEGMPSAFRVVPVGEALAVILVIGADGERVSRSPHRRSGRVGR